MDKDLLNEEKSFVATCKFLLWLFTGLIITFIGMSNVMATSITDYATRYYYGEFNSSTTNYTDYRTGSNNKVTLLGPTAPTYANAETFNGFYNRINYNLTKGSIYTLSLSISFSNLATGEWGENNINNRLLSTDFAHCSDCTVTAVSGSIRRYNSTNPAVSNLSDYVVQMNYTFVATSNASQWYIGSYTGDDRTIGVNEHQYTSIVMVYSLDISNDNSSTIINQNETIINQNQQMIDENAQNTQDIINNQNQNTQDIIDNQNELATSCETFSYTPNQNIGIRNKILNSSGQEIDEQNWAISNYFKVVKDEIITLSPLYWSTNNRYCLYDDEKDLLSCASYNPNPINITIQKNGYIRYNLRPNWSGTTTNPNTFVTERCINREDKAEDTRKGIFAKIKELFTFFSNDDDADVTGLNNMAGWLPPGPLDSIINLPLNLFNSLVNTLSGTCSSITLTLPFVNQTLTLPCFDSFMSQYLTGFDTLWTFIGVTVSIFILYNYLLTLYKWIDDTLTLRENNLPGYYDDNWGGGA